MVKSLFLYFNVIVFWGLKFRVHNLFLPTYSRSVGRSGRIGFWVDPTRKLYFDRLFATLFGSYFDSVR